MSTKTKSDTLYVGTSLTDAEIEKRVEEVKEFERFSVFTFEFRSESHADKVFGCGRVQVTSKDGSVYVGYVEDWDEAHYFVNLH